MTENQKTQSMFGNKVVCKRPNVLFMCVQIVNIDAGNGAFKKEINLDFGDMPGSEPDYSSKQTVRLNKGEIAHLFGCLLGYIPKAGAKYRESGLWVTFVMENGDKYINLKKAKENLKYINLQSSEAYQIYQLCLECLKDEGQSSRDVIFELQAFFGKV